MSQAFYYKILVGNKYAAAEYIYSCGCTLPIGAVVEIEYGKSSAEKNRTYGICISECSYDGSFAIKPILRVFDYVVCPKLIEFAKVVASYNLVSIGSVIEMILPASAFASNPLKMLYRVDDQLVSLDQLIKNGKRRTTIEKLESVENTVHEFDDCGIKFSADQLESVRHIKDAARVSLLEGTTGSGKTLVALKGASEKCLQGKVLIITPEVSLGKNWGAIIEQHFKHHPCFYHYKISDLYKSSVLHWAMSDEPGFIIGARSALFLPYKNLSMIIIDEEHSQSLKQERYPRYHARDMAILRAQSENIPCLLLSATPSLETQYNIELGKYQHTKLLRKPEHGHAQFQFVAQEKHQILSPIVLEEMEHAFAKNQQVILFLNRKGYAPYCICNECNSLLRCRGCDVARIFYSNYMVVCHKCGSVEKLPTVCPSCNKQTTWKFYGIGVEKLLEFTQEMFPQRVIRAVTSQTKEIDEYIEDLNNKKIDCLIATQVLAQGHDFKNVSLVVIVDADMGLNSPDFRASERMLQLWQQIRGRSARHNCEGKLLVQGLSQENKFIKLFNSENPGQELMQERRDGNWPPFSKCAFIIVKSKDFKQAQVYFGSEIFHKLRNSSIAGEIEFYGPLYIGKQAYVHEWRFLIKVLRAKRVDLIMRSIILQLPKISQINLEFEVDPYTFT